MIDITNKLMQFLSDNMFSQFKTWDQLLSDTNKIFKWDRLVKEDYQILYEKGLEYAGQRNYKKAGETFYKAASLAERKKQDEMAQKMLYCAWECALWCGNPEPLTMYTGEMYSTYNNKIPSWLVERLGTCAMAHVGYAEMIKDKKKSAEYHRLGGWLFTQYFNKTGDYKDYDNEWIFYVFYGYSTFKVGGAEYFASYVYDMKKHVPEKYVRKVLKCWDEMIIK